MFMCELTIRAVITVKLSITKKPKPPLMLFEIYFSNYFFELINMPHLLIHENYGVLIYVNVFSSDFILIGLNTCPSKSVS